MLDDISLNQVENYLIKEGWTANKEYKNKNLNIFNKDDYTITIPSNQTFKDFKVRLSEAINLLCDINSQEFENIVKDIKIIQYDRISFRVIGEIAMKVKYHFLMLQNM